MSEMWLLSHTDLEKLEIEDLLIGLFDLPIDLSILEILFGLTLNSMCCRDMVGQDGYTLK